jgi:hypothetical protein
MLLLLAAVDEGLGAGLFGLVGDENDRLRELLGMPADLEIVGVVRWPRKGCARCRDRRAKFPWKPSMRSFAGKRW